MCIRVSRYLFPLIHSSMHTLPIYTTIGRFPMEFLSYPQLIFVLQPLQHQLYQPFKNPITKINHLTPKNQLKCSKQGNRNQRRVGAQGHLRRAQH